MSYDGIPLRPYDEEERNLKREITRLNSKIEILCQLLSIDGVSYDDIEKLRNGLEVEKGRVITRLNTI